MNLSDFNYQYLKTEFPDEWDYWYGNTHTFDHRLDIIPENKVKGSRASISFEEKKLIIAFASKVRNASYAFTSGDNAGLELLIEHLDAVYHDDNWITNYKNNDYRVLSNGRDFPIYSFVNEIRKSSSFESFKSLYVFRKPSANTHLAHVFAAIKNIQDDQEFPVYYVLWQNLYALIYDAQKPSYDALVQFFNSFQVPSGEDKYQAFGAALNLFHVEYLNYCLYSNQGYKTTSKWSKRLQKFQINERTEFLKTIYTPMQATSTINIDKWRVISEPLFKSYIKCYQLLESGAETSPGKAMVTGLEENDELRTVTERTYSSAYTIARELGIFYEGDNDDFHLSKAANKYINGELSYENYLKKYILSTEFFIGNQVVHPFEEISQAISTEILSLDDILSKCPKCVPDKSPPDSVRECFRLFLDRAVLAGLVSKNNFKYSLNTSLEDITKMIMKSGLSNEEFEKRYVGKGKDHQKNIVTDFIDRGIDAFKVSSPQSNNPNIIQPLNQILYGPPGTGKTYSTITKALVILGLLDEKKDYTKQEYAKAQKDFKKELGERIEFVTMHQSYSYEDFIQGLKPNKSKDGKGVVFDYKNGVFKSISKRASKNFDAASKHVYFPSYVMSKYEKLLEGSNVLPVSVSNQNERLEYFSSRIDPSKGNILVKAPRDCFDRLLGESSPRDGWTKANYKNKEHWETCEQTLPYFEDIPEEKCIELIHKNWVKTNEVEYHEDDLSKAIKKSHVIILDEINRCNVSKVFGELITLIEDDKREKFETTLPSGERFTVPKNLYIIGTMNTADKSISMVDIALRRRFEFEAIYPKPELVKDDEKREFMKSVNAIIRERKSIDFEIGHSDFMKSLSFEDTLNRKVIPLLVEYFRNDMSAVKDIITKCIDSTSSVQISNQWFESTGLVKVEQKSN